MKHSRDNIDELENVSPQKRRSISDDTAEALFTAANEGNLDRVRDLIAKGVKLTVDDAAAGSLYLFLAISSGNTQTAQALITAGADKETLMNDRTPLHFAIENNRTEIAVALINAGADKETLYQDMTPLQHAIILDQTEITQALINAGANIEALFIGMAPLHLAISGKNIKIALALIAAGANLEARFVSMTPLHFAIENSQTEIAAALITAGANKAIPFHMLKNVSDPTLIKALLPHCLIDGYSLANLLSNPDHFNSDECRSEFLNCTSPMDFLKSKNLLLPVALAALELLRIANEVKEYEESFILIAEDAMDDSKVARANWHFENKVKPHFKNVISAFVTVNNHKVALMTTLPESGPEQDTLYVGINGQNQLHYTLVTQNGEVVHDSLNHFLEEGKTLTEETLAELAGSIVDEVVKMAPILAIEKQIRALILDAIQKKAEEDKEQPIIAFINDNKDKLINADPSVMQASCAIFTQTHPAQAAWRGYNPYAPVSHEWENLLTRPVDNAVVYSTRFAHQGALHAHTASEIARERVAYYYLGVIDPNDGDDSTRDTRIENFINQLADIRNTHGLDNPSCYPGTITRCAEMGAYHSVAQLPPTTKELIADFVKVKVLAAFHDEIEKLPTFAEKEALYNALVELTTLQAKDVIVNPERYQPEWLALRQHFITLMGTVEEIVLHITENNLFPMVEKDSILVEQALLDIAGGTTLSALANNFSRQTDSVPTLADKKKANPFSDENSAEHTLTRALLDAILQAVPQYATSIRKLLNLSGYLANKVPELITGAPVKNLLAGLEIADEHFDDVLQKVTSALENTGWKAPTLIANPFDAKVKQMEMLMRNLPPAKAAPYRKPFDSVKNKQQRFNNYLPLLQQAFQDISIENERLVRLTEAFASNLATSKQGFDQDAFCETLNDADKLFVIEHRKRLADLAMRLLNDSEKPGVFGSNNRMR